MKKMPPLFRLLVVLGAVAVWYFGVGDNTGTSPGQVVVQADSVLASAYANNRSNLQIRGSGVVSRVLSDDLDGDRHQRFILRLGSGQTILVAHNIDLAPRVAELSVGDAVEFFGEYEWSEQGGVIHWTHADPAGRHQAGWLSHRGIKYQ